MKNKNRKIYNSSFNSNIKRKREALNNAAENITYENCLSVFRIPDDVGNVIFSDDNGCFKNFSLSKYNLEAEIIFSQKLRKMAINFLNKKLFSTTNQIIIDDILYIMFFVKNGLFSKWLFNNKLNFIISFKPFKEKGRLLFSTKSKKSSGKFTPTVRKIGEAYITAFCSDCNNSAMLYKRDKFCEFYDEFEYNYSLSSNEFNKMISCTEKEDYELESFSLDEKSFEFFPSFWNTKKKNIQYAIFAFCMYLNSLKQNDFICYNTLTYLWIK